MIMINYSLPVCKFKTDSYVNNKFLQIQFSIYLKAVPDIEKHVQH